MATIQSIQKNINEHLASMGTLSDDDKKKQIKAIEYILQLSGLTSTNISRWDINAIFGTGQANRLCDEKREINKRFFERKSTAESSPQENNDAMQILDNNQGLSDAINNYVRTIHRTSKEELEHSLRENVRTLNDVFNKVESYTKKIFEVRTRIAIIDGQNPAEMVKAELAKIIKEGNWVNPVFEGGSLYFNTKNNVVISYKNRAAAVDLDLNCGQMAVRIDMNSGNVVVIPYKNNIKCNGFMHPHVHNAGSVCWGDARNNVAQWVSDGKLSNVLQILYSLLFNYNDGNPYIHLQELKTNGRKYGLIPEGMLHPDIRKKKEEKRAASAARAIERQNSNATTGPFEYPPDYTGVRLQIGDTVACEGASEDSGSPRWDMDTDRGGSGSEIRGVVQDINSTSITLRLDNGVMWNICNFEHDDYSDSFWSNPGYFRKV